MPSKPRKPRLPALEEPRLSRGRSRDGAIFPVAPPVSELPESYATTLQEIKSCLRNARVRAILTANPIVIEAYWHTGKIILARQQEAAWGAKIIDRLAADLQEAFPDMGGLSGRNLLSMKLFAEAFPGGSIAKQLVSQLPWGQIIRLLRTHGGTVAQGLFRLTKPGYKVYSASDLTAKSYPGAASGEIYAVFEVEPDAAYAGRKWDEPEVTNQIKAFESRRTYRQVNTLHRRSPDPRVLSLQALLRAMR